MGTLLNLEHSLEFQVRKNKAQFSKILNTDNEQKILEQLTKYLKILDREIPLPSIGVYHSEKLGYCSLEEMGILERSYPHGSSFGFTEFGLNIINAYRTSIGKKRTWEQRAELYQRIANLADHLS